jgi:uroporphyrinogen III methyltransferase/synthase
MKSKGIVYLVGAGPGDANLLTLRGAELLRRADVVVCDVRVNPELLRLAPAAAESVPHDHRKRADNPAPLPELVLARAREGKTVVRLTAGDPFIFGLGGEEAEMLAEADIAFEIVPGVSPLVAAPGSAGIPLTHRLHGSSFTVFPGPGGQVDAARHSEQMAKIPGTKVVQMDEDHLGEWAKALIAHGMPATTPVAIIQAGTTGRQISVSGTLATIAGLAAKKKIIFPAIAIVGDVVKLREKLNWFERRPLFGQRIVVTRRAGQSEAFAMQLAELGADVLEVPTIKLTRPTECDAIIDCMLELNAYEWFVFTSANGVTEFFDMFFRRFQDLRDIGGARIAAVGPATAAKLRELHLQVDLTPEAFTGRKIAEAFVKYQNIENVKICLLRAEAANRDLPDALQEMGAIVDDIAIYKTVAETEDRTGAAARLLAEGADWVTFTSGSTVEHFNARFNLPKLVKQFPQLKIASIGPETTKALDALKLKPAIEAKTHTADGLITALLKAAKAGSV